MQVYKMSKMMKNAYHYFPEPTLTSLNYFFSPTSSPKPKGSSFTVINDKEKQQILTFKKLEPANGHFCFKKNCW